MSDSKDSTVTYTVVSSLFADLPDIVSPRVDGPPVMIEDLYAYVVDAFQAPPSPNYVSGPEGRGTPAEEQPLPVAVSPVADLPGYVPESDPEEDPEEDDDEDPEEDPADYPADGGSPSAEEIEPFETDEYAATPPPHPAYRVTTRISIRDDPPIPFWSDTEVAKLLAIPTPPPSPLSLWSSPLPQIPCPPLPLILSPPLPVSSPPPASPIRPLGYRAAMIRLRAEAPSTSHSLPLPPPIILSYTRSDAPSSGIPPLLPIPLPTSSPPLHLLSTDRRADILEVTLPPRKRLGIRVDYGFVAPMDREIMWDLERDVGYGITDTWDEILGRQDTYEILCELVDEQLGQLMAGRLNMLYRDRRARARTARTWRVGSTYMQWITELQDRGPTQMTEFKSQQGPAKGLTQPDAPEEAGSSS
ncbi:hypothetical protein Tco_0281375 [Tanacetum coccineum]